MSDPDKDLEDYLNGDSEVSNTYRTTMGMEPPKSLDNAILREARNAVKKKGGFLSWLRMGESASLVPAMALASVAVLAFVIVMFYGPFTQTGEDPNTLTEKSKKGDQELVNPNKGKLQVVKDTKQPDYTKSPEAWLKHIAELKKAGKTEDADKSLEAFKKKYPDYKLTK